MGEFERGPSRKSPEFEPQPEPRDSASQERVARDLGRVATSQAIKQEREERVTRALGRTATKEASPDVTPQRAREHER